MVQPVLKSTDSNSSRCQESEQTCHLACCCLPPRLRQECFAFPSRLTIMHCSAVWFKRQALLDPQLETICQHTATARRNKQAANMAPGAV
jgi:hypothetical protein